MNITEDIINQVADQMTKDIDTQIVMSALGWKAFDISEGRVYGARYLTVHPNRNYDWNEMESWAKSTFGPTAPDGVWTPKMRWYVNNSKFWFRDKKDLEWFILRWA